MILSGKEIKKEIDKNIIISDFNEKRLNPNSYNLRLYNELLIYKRDTLYMNKENENYKILFNEGGFVLRPNKLYLGRTAEYTETHKYIPMLEGRSSIGRLGIFIHITAGFGDVGFKGYWTLEISCIQPVVIYPFVEICQIYYHEIKGDYDEYKSKKYQGNKDIQPSLIYKEFEGDIDGK
jgi:dCTP deaminase